MDRERGARRRAYVEAAHQRLGAVVAGAHAHALTAEDLADVVWVGALDRERRERAAVGRIARAMQREARNLEQPIQQLRGQRLLVRVDRLDPDLLDEVNGRTEPDRLGDRRRAGLEFAGQGRPTSMCRRRPA